MKLQGLDKAEAWKGLPILPPGSHNVTITEAEEGKSSNNHPQYIVKFQGDAGIITDWITFTEGSAGKVRAFLEAAGFEISADLDIPAERLVGRKLAIYVQKEPKNSDPSQMVSNVKGYMPAGSGSDVPADTSDFETMGSQGNNDDIPF